MSAHPPVDVRGPHEPFERQHPFDPRTLHTPDGFERVLAHCQARGLTWYTRTHAHTCPHCGRVLTHTGLQATLTGDQAAHTCSGIPGAPDG